MFSWRDTWRTCRHQLETVSRPCRVFSRKWPPWKRRRGTSATLCPLSKTSVSSCQKILTRLEQSLHSLLVSEAVVCWDYRNAVWNQRLLKWIIKYVGILIVSSYKFSCVRNMKLRDLQWSCQNLFQTTGMQKVSILINLVQLVTIVNDWWLKKESCFKN